MSRADDCAEANGPHLKHVPVCQRTGYADALDEVEQAIAALVAEIEGVSSAGGYRIGLQHARSQVKAARG